MQYDGETGGVKVLMLEDFKNFKLVQGDSCHLITIGSRNSKSAKHNNHCDEIIELSKQTRNIANYTRKSHKARSKMKEIDANGKPLKGQHKFCWKSEGNHQQSVLDAYTTWLSYHRLPRKRRRKPRNYCCNQTSINIFLDY